MPVLEPVAFFASQFADDFIALVLLCWLSTVLDVLDVHCAGTTQATNFDKTAAFGIGAYATEPAPWDPAGRIVLLAATGASTGNNSSPALALAGLVPPGGFRFRYRSGG